jgi:hypothetical protein
MAVPPTYINTFGPTTISNQVAQSAVVTANAGDLLILSATAGTDTWKANITAAGGQTWTQRADLGPGSGTASFVRVWTATAASTGTFTVTLTPSDSAGHNWFMQVQVFRNGVYAGVASILAGGSAPSLSITTTNANSAIAMVVSDFNAISGASRAYRTGAGAFSETQYVTSTFFTYYNGYHADAGTAAAKTVGLTAPTGQAPTMVAIEVAPGPAPTFVARYGPAVLQTSTTLNQSVTVANGDLLVCIVGGESGGITATAPTGGTGLTWTQRVNQPGNASPNSANMQIWTAPVTSAQTSTLTVTVANGGTFGQWTAEFQRWSGVSAVGAVASAAAVTTGTQAITTTAGNSAIAWGSTDWNAIDGTTRAYSTATAGTNTETTYRFSSGRATFYAGYYADSGAAGAKTVGATTPSGQKSAIGAVELKGPSVTLPYTETFTGTTGTAWPSVWTGTAGTTTIQANKGRLTTPTAVNSVYKTGIRTLSMTAITGDIDVIATMYSVTQTWNWGFVQIQANGSKVGAEWEPTSGYMLWVTESTSQIARYNPDTSSVALTADTAHGVDTFHSTTVGMKVRIQKIGTTLRSKLWRGDATEPTAWFQTVTDSGAALPAGKVALLNTNNADTVDAVMDWDDVTVSVPASSSTLNKTKFGTVTVANAYFGTTVVSKMYVGSTQIFP